MCGTCLPVVRVGAEFLHELVEATLVVYVRRGLGYRILEINIIARTFAVVSTLQRQGALEGRRCSRERGSGGQVIFADKIKSICRVLGKEVGKRRGRLPGKMQRAQSLGRHVGDLVRQMRRDGVDERGEAAFLGFAFRFRRLRSLFVQYISETEGRGGMRACAPSA